MENLGKKTKITKERALQKLPIIFNSTRYDWYRNRSCKTGEVRFIIIFRINLYSVTSMERSQRDLWSYATEHNSILKNYTAEYISNRVKSITKGIIYVF